MNSMDDLSLHQRWKLRNGFRELLDGFEWQYFVTANFNRDTNWWGAKKALKDWHAGIDRRLLGGRWAKKEGKRTFFIAGFEGAETNQHWHMKLTLRCDKNEKFENIAPEVWESIVPGGSLDIHRVQSMDDEKRTSNYSTKDLLKPGLVEALVISTEFQTCA